MEDHEKITTLAEAKTWLRDRVDDGAHCPCCGQYAKIYKRRINSSMARTLIKMWRGHGYEWAHIPDEFARHGGDIGKLRYWELLEEAIEPRDDGGRAGWWRVTDRGRRFVLNLEQVPKYARIYDGRRLGFEGGNVSIIDALSAKFDYNLLMSGTA